MRRFCGRGLYRTLIWQPGELIVEEYTIPIDASAPDGSYRLAAGAYDPNLARLKQVGRNGAAEDDEISLAEITVAR